MPQRHKATRYVSGCRILRVVCFAYVPLSIQNILRWKLSSNLPGLMFSKTRNNTYISYMRVKFKLFSTETLHCKRFHRVGECQRHAVSMSGGFYSQEVEDTLHYCHRIDGKTVSRSLSQHRLSGSWSRAVYRNILSRLQTFQGKSELFLHTDFHCIFSMFILTEILRNGGDDKSKNLERNPSNILPGNGYRYLLYTDSYSD